MRTVTSHSFGRKKRRGSKSECSDFGGRYGWQRLTSTQVDESAQHFYRKSGYKDCGSLILDIPKYAQPMEMFLVKEI